MRNLCADLKVADVHNAACQGMLWLAHSTLHPDGSTADEAQCFLTISRNARDPFLAEQAAAIHRELLRSHSVDHHVLRRIRQPGEFIDPLSYCTQAERIGDVSPHKECVRKAVAGRDEAFFWNIEPERHTRENCTTLILYYHFDRLGFATAHTLQEAVARCGPTALDRRRPLSEDEFEDQLYFVTHWVYALSDYGARPLSPAEHDDLHGFLTHILPSAVECGNIETLAEVVECLKIFGHRNSEPLMRPALCNILTRQNPDGSWGSVRYQTLSHATWCAVTALYEYRQPCDTAWGPPARRSYIASM